MSKRSWLAVALAATAAACGGGSSTSPGASASSTVLDQYPFVASKAIAHDGDTLFDGAGGGIVFLHHQSPPASPPLELAAPAALATAGMVVDLVATPDYLYAATWKNGLVVVRRSDSSIVHAQPLAGTEGAWRLTVFDADPSTCATKRVVLIGTFDADASAAPPASSNGRLVIVEHDRSDDSLAVRAQFELGANVECVAASSAIAPPPSPGYPASFSALVGADCATLAGDNAWLQRRDFSYDCSAGELAFHLDDTLAWPGAVAEPAHIPRAIAIDESASRAYVAAYFDGVFAFDVHAGVLARDLNPAWPIHVDESPGVARRGYADCIALDPAPQSASGLGARLFVGFGAPFRGEWQYLGDSSKPECALAPVDDPGNPVHGIVSFRLDAHDEPIAGANGIDVEFAIGDQLPLDWGGVSKLDVERVALDTVYVYAALDTKGCAVVRGDELNGSLSASLEAQWASAAPGEMPLASHDDLTMLRTSAGDHVLYVTTEDGVVAFDLDQVGAAQPLADVACPSASAGAPVPCGDFQQALTIAGFPEPNGRLVASTVHGIAAIPGGLRVYDLANPVAPVALGPELDKGGRGFGIAAVDGLYAGPPPSPADVPRWVMTTQSQALALDASWTVEVWDFGTRAAPRDPGCAVNCAPRVLDTWQDASDTDAIDGLTTLEVVPGRELAIYAPYAVNLDSPQSVAAASAGLVVLKVTLDANGAVQIAKQTKTVDFTGVDGNFAIGRATVDAAHGRLYVTWGTGAIALYELGDPYHPATLSTRDLRSDVGAYNLRLSPAQVVVGPDACSRSFVYIAFMDQGVGILDATSDLAGPIQFLSTRGQALSLLVDPRDPTLRTLFTTEGRAGVDQLMIDPCH